jgi:hypothetical protein
MSTSNDGREQERDAAVTEPSGGEPEESVPDLPNPETGVGWTSSTPPSPSSPGTA